MKQSDIHNIEVVKEPLPVYETWLEYFKRHPHLSDREKNTFIDNMICFNTPMLFYSPSEGYCKCYKDLKPGEMIPMDDVKRMICAKCHKPIRSLSK